MGGPDEKVVTGRLVHGAQHFGLLLVVPTDSVHVLDNVAVEAGEKLVLSRPLWFWEWFPFVLCHRCERVCCVGVQTEELRLLTEVCKQREWVGDERWELKEMTYCSRKCQQIWFVSWWCEWISQEGSKG